MTRFAETSDRADDELRLEMLRRAMAGESLIAISRSFGRSKPYAHMTIGKVMRCDLAESGEPAVEILKFYPRIKP